MTTRNIPYKLPALMKLGTEALAGVEKRGESAGVAQNTAPRVAADHYDLFGEPGENPTNPGKQAALNAKRDAVLTARAVRRAAIASGREFCGKAVDLLKGYFGRTWNPAWMAAGFTRFSIAVTKADVAIVLVEIRNYFRKHADREVAPLGITAAVADAKLTAVDAANVALNAAISARNLATEQRDAAVQKLRDRLSGLREELNRLLEDDDHRWYEFGFSRPVDGRRPSPVTGLTATPGLPGQVLVQHASSERATDYRVSWELADGSGQATTVGLFADGAVMLSELPGGVLLSVRVTARNKFGETPPATITVIAPLAPAAPPLDADLPSSEPGSCAGCG